MFIRGLKLVLLWRCFNKSEKNTACIHTCRVFRHKIRFLRSTHILYFCLCFESVNINPGYVQAWSKVSTFASANLDCNILCCVIPCTLATVTSIISDLPSSHTPSISYFFHTSKFILDTSGGKNMGDSVKVRVRALVKRCPALCQSSSGPRLSANVT